MKLENNIIFHGYVNDNQKKYLLKSSWIFVNPSSMEGWGVTVIEANAVGTPALAFNVPGLKEAIRHNETGYLAKDEKEMIRNIILLIKNEKLRKKLGENAKKWSKKFSWDATADKTLKLIKQIK